MSDDFFSNTLVADFVLQHALIVSYNHLTSKAKAVSGVGYFSVHVSAA